MSWVILSRSHQGTRLHFAPHRQSGFMRFNYHYLGDPHLIILPTILTKKILL